MRNRNRQPLIPIRHSKEEALLILCCSGHSHILTSHLTAGRATPERGCNHFLPNKQPSPPSLFLPEVETGLSSRVCGRRLQPQGCVISVRHSQQYGSHGDSAHKKTQPSSANHFSSEEVLARVKGGKIEGVKSLSETPLCKVFLGFPAALKSCFSLFVLLVQSQEANMRSLQSLRNVRLHPFLEKPQQGKRRQTSKCARRKL